MHDDLQMIWSFIDGTHKMRDETLDTLTDGDLAFNPGGAALTLGELCKEMGEVQHAYTESLKNYTQDFNYRTSEADITTSLAALKAWFAKLDGEMSAAMEAVSDPNKNIARQWGEVPVKMQMEVYLQALLIFLAKLTVYLRVMNKPLTQKMQEWIG